MKGLNGIFLPLGTEMRIPSLQDEAVSTPRGLKTVLDNPFLRQQYVIDADIETTTMAAIYSAEVKRDKQGKVIYSPAGGKRRIDGILYRKDTHLVRDSEAFIALKSTYEEKGELLQSPQCSISMALAFFKILGFRKSYTILNLWFKHVHTWPSGRFWFDVLFCNMAFPDQ